MKLSKVGLSLEELLYWESQIWHSPPASCWGDPFVLSGIFIGLDPRELSLLHGPHKTHGKHKCVLWTTDPPCMLTNSSTAAHGWLVYPSCLRPVSPWWEIDSCPESPLIVLTLVLSFCSQTLVAHRCDMREIGRLQLFSNGEKGKSQHKDSSEFLNQIFFLLWFFLLSVELLS